MRRREKFLVMLLLSLFFCSVTVWAEDEDVWRPDDPFYIEHAESCIPNGRNYQANGPNGQVILYESPASSQIRNTLENGEVTPIDYIYTNENGIEWGFCEVEGIMGWLPMPYMVLCYDYLCFEEDYAEQIQEERGKPVPNEAEITNAAEGIDDEIIEIIFAYFGSNKRIKFWEYPGSTERYIIPGTDSSTGVPSYSKTFIDEDGRKWGFVTYFRGAAVNRWICISSVQELMAEFEELYPNGAPERDTRVIEAYDGEEIFPDDYEHVQKMQKIEKAVKVGGICLVLVIFATFYRIMWRKMKQA